MVNIYNAVGTVNVVADVAGYFAPDVATDYNGLFHPMAPLRVCDTRKSCEGNVALRAKQSIRVDVTAGGGIPNDGTAGSAVLNLTGVGGTAATFLSVFPTNTSGGCTFPGTSNLNLAAGAVEANRVMVKLGPATTGGPRDLGVRVQRGGHDQRGRGRQRVVRKLDRDGHSHGIPVSGGHAEPDL